MTRQDGFSLIELLVAISIVAIVMAITVPNVLSWLPNYRLKAAASDLMSNIQKAKIMAVRNRSNCAIRFDESGGAISGYTIFIDQDANFEYNPDAVNRPFETIITTVSLSDYDSVSISSNTFDKEDDTNLYLFAFRPNGLPITDSGLANGTVTFTNTNGKNASVIVNISGNVRIN